MVVVTSRVSYSDLSVFYSVC